MSVSTYARLLKTGDRFRHFGLVYTVTAEPSLVDDRWLVPVDNGTSLSFTHTRRSGRVDLVQPGTQPAEQHDEPGEWLPIPGASGYELHRDCTRVRSVQRLIECNGQIRSRKGKELVISLNTAGYLHTSIRFDHEPKRHPRSIHRLVCLVFHGPPPSAEHLVRHLNDVKTDNRPENLAWGTKSENAWDSIKHGTHAETNRTHCKYGHPLDGRLRRKGKEYRKCSTCARKYNREKARRWRARKRLDVLKESA